MGCFTVLLFILWWWLLLTADDFLHFLPPLIFQGVDHYYAVFWLIVHWGGFDFQDGKLVGGDSRWIDVPVQGYHTL